MITDKAIERVFTTIQKYCNFTEEDFLSEENFRTVIIDPLTDNCTIAFKWAYGATKVVILPEDSEYVLKIPFNSLCYINDEEDNDEITYEFTSFDHAKTSNGWDYCAAECDTYERALANNLSACFLQTSLYGVINGWPIYIQHKCELHNTDNEDECGSKEERKYIRNLCKSNHYYALPFTWALDFYNYYGETMLIALLNFLRAEHLYDFHKDNVGYFGDVPIILDYGDYRE